MGKMSDLSCENWSSVGGEQPTEITGQGYYADWDCPNATILKAGFFVESGDNGVIRQPKLASN